jgi:hypothetical protein
MKARMAMLPVLWLVLGASSPGCGGTGTGNPGWGPQDVQALATPEVAWAVCGVLVRCNPGLSPFDCAAGVWALPDLDDELGIAPGTYADFAATYAAEKEGELVADGQELVGCVAGIQALACTDPAVVAAYQPGAPAPFAQVPGLVSCPGVFAH